MNLNQLGEEEKVGWRSRLSGLLRERDLQQGIPGLFCGKFMGKFVNHEVIFARRRPYVLMPEVLGQANFPQYSTRIGEILEDIWNVFDRDFFLTVSICRSTVTTKPPIEGFEGISPSSQEDDNQASQLLYVRRCCQSLDLCIAKRL